jgi:phage-related tail protein
VTSQTTVIRDIQAIQNQPNGLQTSKTITTLYNTAGESPSAPRVGASSSAALHAAHFPGFAKGTSGAGSGWAWVGEKGPELVNFRGGETVIPNHVARGYAGGAGDFEPAVHEVHVFLDGKKIYQSTRQEAVNTQRRTGSNGLSERYR